MIFMGFLSYRSSEETVKRISMNYAQDMLQMIELRFQDFINNLNVISQDLLYDKKIYNILNQERGINPLIDYEAENEISNTIKSLSYQGRKFNPLP